MKKVLSLVLVAILAIGMASVAFGATSTGSLLDDNFDYTKIKDFAYDMTLANGVYSGYETLNTDSRVADMGTVAPNDKPELIIKLYRYLFAATEADETTQNVYYKIDIEKMYRANVFTWDNDRNITNTSQINSVADMQAVLKKEIEYPAASGNFYNRYDPAYIIMTQTAGSSASNANKVLRAYLSAGFLTTTTDKDDAFVFPSNMDLAPDHKSATYSGSIVYTSNEVDNNKVLTSTEIQKSRITVHHSVTGDSTLIRKLEIDRSAGEIVFQPVREFVSTSSADMEINIYISIDGKRFDQNHSVRVLLELKNPIIEVYKEHNWVDLSEGRVAEAIDFNSSVAVYLGNGVTIHTKFFKDKKYYGIATRDTDEEFERVLKQYKDVDNVLTLKVVGLNNVGDYITLDNDYAGYYVYDKDMNYLGKGDEDLKFSSKLYLAYNKLDIEEDEEYEAEEEEAPVPETQENPETGGNGQAANNTNMNPGTGR